MIALNPNLPQAHRFLGITYLEKKMYDEAIAEHQEAVALTGGDSSDLFFLGGAYAAAGNTAQARKILQELEQRSTGGEYVDPFAYFYILSMLGDVDEAFPWLEQSISEHSCLGQAG